MQNAKQEFPCQSLESFLGEYYNIKNKIDLQFRPVYANQTCPDYSAGSDQDEAEIQYDRCSTQEWYNSEKCKKMSAS